MHRTFRYNTRRHKRADVLAKQNLDHLNLDQGLQKACPLLNLDTCVSFFRTNFISNLRFKLLGESKCFLVFMFRHGQFKETPLWSILRKMYLLGGNSCSGVAVVDYINTYTHTPAYGLLKETPNDRALLSMGL